MLVALLSLLCQSAASVQVNPAELSGAKEPQIAVNQEGVVGIAYAVRNTIYLSTTMDGSKFSQPMKVAEAGQLSLGMRRGPRIASSGQAFVITAIYGEKGRGADGDILAFRWSGGDSFEGPIRVNDVSGSAREGLHAMAAAPDGTLACVWLDLRDNGTKLYASFSRDKGASWTPNGLVYASPSGTICECCHPSVTFGSDGKLYIMFRNALNGARDMYLTTSTDLETFNPPIKLGSGTWKLAACPMDGGMIAVESGGISTVWRRESSIYLNTGGESELLVDSGKNPWIAVGKKGAYVTWEQEGSVFLKLPDSQSPSKLTERGSDPVVTADPSGNRVFAAWNENGIRLARVDR